MSFDLLKKQLSDGRKPLSADEFASWLLAHNGKLTIEPLGDGSLEIVVEAEMCGQRHEHGWRGVRPGQIGSVFLGATRVFERLEAMHRLPATEELPCR